MEIQLQIVIRRKIERIKNEIIEVSDNQSTYAEVEKNIPNFDISIDESKDINSIYYFKHVDDFLIKLDTVVTAEQIIGLTRYKIYSNIINPTYLDSLAKKHIN